MRSLLYQFVYPYPETLKAIYNISVWVNYLMQPFHYLSVWNTLQFGCPNFIIISHIIEWIEIVNVHLSSNTNVLYMTQPLVEWTIIIHWCWCYRVKLGLKWQSAFFDKCYKAHMCIKHQGVMSLFLDNYSMKYRRQILAKVSSWYKPHPSNPSNPATSTLSPTPI